ncbi:MAG TPA: tetratricopeptide repeat protein, partial [Candidatus Desulfofervidus auxilii]|nr:tetratricopeptide repeat protein [Candidatus Desulfofervidus auxilii]
DFDEALRINPTYAPAYLAKARIYQILGNKRKLEENLKMIIRLGDARLQKSLNIYDERRIREKLKEIIRYEKKFNNR